MKTTVNFNDFVSAFSLFDGRMAKNGEPGNFDYDGLRVLFNYLEELEQDCGEEYELDVIALCCDFAQDNVESIAEQYSIDIEGLDEYEQREAVLDHIINSNSTVCGETSSGDIVYQQF
jgi:hypothetical protein